MRNGRALASLAIGLSCAAIAAYFVIFPQDVLDAALKGLSIWWDVLFPSLFPFFVISEIMLGFGVVHFFGTLLDPLMRPLFRIPGLGGFVMAMGFASGYPVASKLTTQLWDQKVITRTEGERLVAFTTTSDPIFLIGAVCIGFYHDVSLAPVLASAHYGAAVVIGLMMRFYKGSSDPQDELAAPLVKLHNPKPLLYRALQSMHRARMNDGRSFGLLLRQAVESSFRLIIVVGGLVVFFAVILETLALSGVLAVIYAAVAALLKLLALPLPLSDGIVNGFFEVTLGARSAGEASGVPLVQKAAIGAVVLSWAGLSVHAQIASLVSRCGFRYKPFLFARAMHSIIAFILVLILWNPLQGAREAASVWLPVESSESAAAFTKLWSFPAAALTLGALLLGFSLLAVTVSAITSKTRTR
ncbi:sporulation integral membrane protein YlbJ [Paenibacillus turpanensis]|uniref:sporulation integral membrane protein YlbJ n=1 Tax=Paenibacillus turpanensis TaxID=2689078 RepID=UPI00140B4735|nr:sporulation integral membrane protein YlbJ [Paenibacillus turpanensis]